MAKVTPVLFIRAFTPDEAYRDQYATAEASAWFVGHAKSDTLTDEALQEVLASGDWSEVDPCERGEAMADGFEKHGYTVFQSGPEGIFVPEGLFDEED